MENFFASLEYTIFQDKTIITVIVTVTYHMMKQIILTSSLNSFANFVPSDTKSR